MLKEWGQQAGILCATHLFVRCGWNAVSRVSMLIDAPASIRIEEDSGERKGNWDEEREGP